MSVAGVPHARAGARQSDALHRALAASGESRCWLLVDQTVRPLIGDEPLAQTLASAGSEFVRLPSPHPGIDSNFMPQLVLLDSARAADSAAMHSSIDDALVECEPESLQRGAARRIGGWLQSTATGAMLARHIARQMVHRRPDGRLTLLRWTDPAVLWAMWPMLGSPQQHQQRALLGPITAYHLLDPAGQSIRLAVPPSFAVESTFVERKLVFTDAQWRELDAIGPLNQALLQAGAARFDTASLNAARDGGLAAILRARALGFSDTRDLAAFAWRAISTHPRFDAHPLVAERLQTRQADDFFTALVDSLDESEWSRITIETPVRKAP